MCSELWQPHEVPGHMPVDLTTKTGICRAIRCLVASTKPDAPGTYDTVMSVVNPRNVSKMEMYTDKGISMRLLFMSITKHALVDFGAEKIYFIVDARADIANTLGYALVRKLADFPVLDVSKHSLAQMPLNQLVDWTNSRVEKTFAFPIILDGPDREDQRSLKFRPGYMENGPEQIVFGPDAYETGRKHRDTIMRDLEKLSVEFEGIIRIIDPLNDRGARIIEIFRRAEEKKRIDAAIGIVDPEESDEEDMEVVSVPQDQLPPINWVKVDPNEAMAERYGANWFQQVSNTISDEQRGRYLPPRKGVLKLANPNFNPAINKVYEAFYPGTKTTFKVRTIDVRSRLCDPLIASTDAINTVPCLPADQVRDFTDHIRFNDQQLDWNVARDAGKEIPWPGYTDKVTAAGMWVRGIDPKDLSRSTCVLGKDRFGENIVPKYANSTRVPRAFMINQIPWREWQGFAYMPVANPHDPNEWLYLHKDDFHIASGPLDCLPSTQGKRSRKAVMRRCSLCKWVYLCTVQGDVCSHIICTVCLGLTSLVSVDKYVCLVCWTIPRRVTITWDHTPGMQRLHFEAPELVTHRGLAAHYANRFSTFWRRMPTYSSPAEHRRIEARWEEHSSREGWHVMGGAGKEPKDNKDGIPNEKMQ